MKDTLPPSSSRRAARWKARHSFHHWHVRFRTGGVDALAIAGETVSRTAIPRICGRTVAPQNAELLPHQLAVTFTDAESSFVPELSVLPLLNALTINLPAFLVIKTTQELKEVARRIS